METYQKEGLEVLIAIKDGIKELPKIKGRAKNLRAVKELIHYLTSYKFEESTVDKFKVEAKRRRAELIDAIERKAKEDERLH